MSPLARLLALRGHTVSGSDRSYDLGVNLDLFNALKQEGIRLFPQDGSGVSNEIDTFVVTRAVEESIPDVRRANELSLTIQKRPRLMAEMFATGKNIAIGGSSGKSTTTGMISHILRSTGHTPTVMNGAEMLNGNTSFFSGDLDLSVFEADESDGFEDVIVVCPSDIAVLTNISLDHFKLDELKAIFSAYLKQARHGVVINSDCPLSMSLQELNSKVITFGIKNSADITLSSTGLHLTIPGEHNLENGLAAIAACKLFGIPEPDAVEALKSFKGMKRRLELVATTPEGTRVYDDFASNPGKIHAAISTLQPGCERLFVIFQPHGFGPTKMMREGYIEVFGDLLRPDDELIMPEIYYIGGSVNLVDGKEVPIPRDISSGDVLAGVAAKGVRTVDLPKRDDIIPYLASRTKSGDLVLVMGSRDETLSRYAQALAAALP